MFDWTRPSLTGGKGWCPKPVHCKYTARKWIMSPACTNPVHLEFIQNFPSQFSCNFPSSGNGQYIHSVPGHVTAMFPLCNRWEHPEFSQRSNCSVPKWLFQKVLCGFPSSVTTV